MVAGGLGDEAIVQEVVRSHREKYGRLDVLVNNAGVGIGEAVADLTAKKIDMQLAVNLRSVFLFYRESVDLLRAAGAEHKNALVVNTSSISGKSGEAWLSVYSATKGAVVELHAGDAQGARARGHQVDGAVPGVRGHADDRLRQGVRSRRTR